MNTPPADTIPEDVECRDPLPIRAYLIAIGSPEDRFAGAGKTFPLPSSGEITFLRDRGTPLESGRGPSGLEIRIPFGWVSGRHATLTIDSVQDPPRIQLRDEGSSNGTHLWGRRLTAPAVLRPGDVFEIGRSFWTVRTIAGPAVVGATADLCDTGTAHPDLIRAHTRLLRLAPSEVPILLRGETGTGKEHLARAIHRASRRPGPFVLANLAAISEERLEARLFGEVGKPGLLEEAHRGTLLLDELSDLSLTAQAKLRTVLSERLGEGEHGRQLACDVRLMATTRHDLARRVDSGAFRPDLYARLAGTVVELPPLRARREDMGLLVRALIERLERGGPSIHLTTNGYRRLLIAAWPFNIRQLAQTLRSAMLLSGAGGTVGTTELEEALEEDESAPQDPEDVRRLRDELVRHLNVHGGDIAAIAQAMRQSPRRIEHWLERLGLRRESYTPSQSP